MPKTIEQKIALREKCNFLLDGVTDNTIRKWCKGYDLPSTKRDLKNII